MTKSRTLVLAVVALGVFTSPGVAQQQAPEQRGGAGGVSAARGPVPGDAAQTLVQSDLTFRSAVASALVEAAQRAGATGVKIRTDDFVAVTLDGGSSVVVNAGIAGVENLDLEQLARGADVLFTFVRLPKGSGLPSGFYTVRILRNDAPAPAAGARTPGRAQWRAQFKNLEGRVVLETDAAVGSGDPALRQTTWSVTIFCCPFSMTFDWSAAKTGGKVSVALGAGGPDTTPLPPAGQKIIKAAGDSGQQAAVNLNSSKSNIYRQFGQVGKTMIASTGDLLAAHAVFQGVEQLTLEELATGQDVFYGYFRTPSGAGLPAGFYTVRIARSATGNWLARFVDATGNTVKEVAAIVDSGTGEQRFTVTGGYGGGCLTIDAHGGDWSITVTLCFS